MQGDSTQPTVDKLSPVEGKTNPCFTLENTSSILDTPTAASSPKSAVTRKRKSSTYPRGTVNSKHCKQVDFSFRRIRDSDEQSLSSSISDNSGIDNFASFSVLQPQERSRSSLHPSSSTATMGLSDRDKDDQENAQSVSVETRLGRIEANAAANFDELKKLLENSISSTESLKNDLTTCINEVKETCDKLEISMNVNNNKLQTQQDDLKRYVENKFAALEVERRSQPLPEQYNDLIIGLNKRIDFLERESKKMNIVIRGLITSSDMAERDVKNLLKSAINVSEGIINVRYLPPQGRYPNKIIVQLNSFEVKSTIMRGKKELLKFPLYRNVYIDRDLTPLESKIAGKIRVAARLAKSNGRTVKYTHNWMSIDNISYRWNEQVQEVLPCPTTPRNTALNRNSESNSQLRSHPGVSGRNTQLLQAKQIPQSQSKNSQV